MKIDPFISDILLENKKILRKNEEIISSNYHIKDKINKIKESLNNYEELKAKVLQRNSSSVFISLNK